MFIRCCDLWYHCGSHVIPTLELIERLCGKVLCILEEISLVQSFSDSHRLLGFTGFMFWGSQLEMLSRV